MSVPAGVRNGRGGRAVPCLGCGTPVRMVTIVRQGVRVTAGKCWRCRLVMEDPRGDKPEAA